MYSLPEIKQPARVKPGEAILVASGDLRLSANQICWAAQAEMERQVIEAFAREGMTVKRGHPYDPEVEARLHLESAHGHGRVREHRPRRAADRRRSRLAVQPSRAGRAAQPSRPDSDRRQLERRMARSGRDAQPERLADQSRASPTARSGASISPTISSSTAFASGSQKARSPTIPATSAT